LEARKEGAFRGVGDLCRRAGILYADAEILIHAGACDGFGHSRPEMLWELKSLFQNADRGTRRLDRSLFPSEAAGAIPPHLPDYSRKRRVDLEWNTLGLLVSMHPIEYYAPALPDRPLILSEDMAAYAGNTVTLIGWLIAERRVGLKGRGAMKFLTFEDPVGVFEAVLFPKVYQQYGHLLASHGPYFVTGEVQDENGYHSLIVDHLERAGYPPRSSRIAEVTPPLRWMFSHRPDDTITHAD
jgi:DNA polymerase III alpha subunit